MKANELIQRIITLENKDKAKILQRFFKTGKGEYGEGDLFLGVSLPLIRKETKVFLNTYIQRKKLIEGKTINEVLNEVKDLLNNKYHEIRVSGCVILVALYPIDEEAVYKFYLTQTEHLNNWDLVDITCYKILGKYLLKKEKDILYILAQSKSLWERRISMVTTMAFIKNGQFEDALKICDILKSDPHDLIHKACGWMLKEIGKKNKKKLITYLNENVTTLHPVTRNYACEHLSNELKQKYKELAKQK
ncbi:hypothetical protein ENUP19_0078G0006 [Entamoeba nuttalli]|uniref:DNA alkylation repair enzyme n=2 Tax=Entamoeba nuttalli TaxID=412467 RepID=K2H730_ENTNP|nr:DNA alkylation repair enzyme [Entamoeba nuttalli P19]EKE38319.1 DNA alkylation repair enzyme [Entamoeba nuttalli P19]|eukprot:XP_008859357.1 DNA alkylation repair enzyme [Entamoeba nuttalli P19]